MGLLEDAIDCYNKALKIKPNDYNSIRQKGVSLSKLGREKEAIDCYNQAIKIQPNDYNSLREMGVSFSKLGQKEEALKWFNLALQIKSEDWWALLGKATILENINENEQANDIYEFIESNLHIIRDNQIIQTVVFKTNALKEKREKTKKDVLSEILNEIIDAAQRQQKGDFFKNINEAESKFKEFVNSKRSIPENFYSFLSVLRKWNSYTPILPSEKGDNKGGGYFLFHQGKGIVIDPGFNFIENFYEEGFKIADIDAVLITHAHNDHTVDLESILTLVYKHNDAIKETIREKIEEKMEDKTEREIEKSLEGQSKKIDLFMNVGTFMKYSGWLNLKDSTEINSVTVLMPNTKYELPKEYCGITIHTTKAKHHEIIDEQYAIGFILDIDGIKVGFTGDTGWDWDRGEIMVKPFKDLRPQLVVAHLGSIKRKEFDYVKGTSDDERNMCFYSHHLGLLGITRFLDETRPKLTIVSEFGEELRDKRVLIVESLDKVLNTNSLPENKLCILPGDIGLHIRLDNFGVHCFIKEDFVDYKSIKVFSEPIHEGSALYFFGGDPSMQIFYDALSKKRLMGPTALCKRTKSYIP